MDFFVVKDIIWEPGGFTHVIYNSSTGTYSNFWEGRNALKKCKEFAKEKGFTRVIIVSKTIRTQDKIYNLK